jgi:carbonic anhydrase
MLRRRILQTALFLPVLRVARIARAEEKTVLTPDEALARLKDGNKRYVESHLSHPHQDAQRRSALSSEQHPFASILCCADSRVSPEIIFDEGLGDLFVVRVAGNIIDDAVIGSLEYAVEHLHTPVVLVVGHRRCGAVQAAIGGGEPKTHIQTLVQAIAPAVAEARKLSGDLVDNTVAANVRLAVGQLKESEPILKENVGRNRIKIVGGVYDLDTGVVSLMPL